MPVVDKYKDMGTVVMGKVEAGECKKGQSLILMPNRVSLNRFRSSFQTIIVVYNILKNGSVKEKY